MGIVAPRFDHFYLFIAYRRLAGKSLTPRDVEQLRRFDPCWDDGSQGYHGKDWNSSPVMAGARAEWQAARALPGLPPVATRKPGGSSVMGYLESSIPNCNPDAFRTAARTLAARMGAHGANAWVRDWALGQDAVFQQCFATGGELPWPAAADAPAWFRADRAYQVAAAHFYAGRYGVSAELFAAIAHDATSPWQPLGRYLAARARIRQASASEGKSEAGDYLKQARQLLDEASATASDPALRTDIARMLQRVRLRIEPEQVVADIDARLSAPTLAPGVGQDVHDFDAQRAGSAPMDPRDPSFAAWLHAMRSGAALAATDSDIGSASQLWLVAMLQSAQPDDPRLTQILERAAAVPASSPAFQTVQYHRIRLLPDRRQALRLARQMLALPEQGLTVQDRNRVKALTLSMAPTAAELAAVAYRAPVALPEVQGLLSRASIPVVDVDGAAILNRALPLDRLHALYMSAETPTPLRRELLGVVWTRAFVLGRWDILHKLLSDVQKRLPAKAALLQQIDATVDPMEKRARAAVFLLLHPGLVGSLSAEITYADPRQPSELALPNMHRYYLHDGSRENWWCSLPAGRYWQQDPMPEPPPAPARSSACRRSGAGARSTAS